MASFVQYTATGSQMNLLVPFPYLERSHVVVSVDGVVRDQPPFGGYDWLNDNTIQTVGTHPPSGALIDIRRVTPVDTRYVDFNDASVLTERDLDALGDSLRFAIQEAQDRSLQVSSDGSLDAGTRPITNVADPTNPGDAVNLQTLINTALNGVTLPADGALSRAYSGYFQAQAGRPPLKLPSRWGAQMGASSRVSSISGFPTADNTAAWVPFICPRRMTVDEAVIFVFDSVNDGANRNVRVDLYGSDLRGMPLNRIAVGSQGPLISSTTGGRFTRRYAFANAQVEGGLLYWFFVAPQNYSLGGSPTATNRRMLSSAAHGTLETIGAVPSQVGLFGDSWYDEATEVGVTHLVTSKFNYDNPPGETISSYTLDQNDFWSSSGTTSTVLSGTVDECPLINVHYTPL